MIKTMTKCRKNAKFTKRENSRLTKNNFSGFLNWILGNLQSSDDENKIAIREISIRAIQKLSDLDQQTIVDGPHFNLTNGKISFIFHYFLFIPFLQKFLNFSSNLIDFPIILTKITVFFILSKYILKKFILLFYIDLLHIYQSFQL